MNIVPEPFADVVRTAEQLADGNVTLTRHGSTNVPDGFVVGGACEGLCLSLHSSRQAVATLVARWLQATPTNVEFVGSWIENGYLYVDGCDILDSYLDAVLLGIERGELAIYNNRTETVERSPIRR